MKVLAYALSGALLTACGGGTNIVSPLNGKWTTGCFEFDGRGNSRSALLTLSIDGTTSTYTESSYSDLECSVPAVLPETGAILKTVNIDTLHVPNASVTTSLGEAQFIDFTTRSSTVNFVTVPKEDLGQNTTRTIYLISDEDHLYFGSPSADNPHARPLTLDVFFFYKRA